MNFSVQLSVEPVSVEELREEQCVRRRTKFGLVGAILFCLLVIAAEGLLVAKGVLVDGRHLPWQMESIEIAIDSSTIVTHYPDVQHATSDPLPDVYNDRRTRVDHRLRAFFDAFCRAQNSSAADFNIRSYTTRRFYVRSRHGDVWFGDKEHGDLALSSVLVTSCESDTAHARVILEDLTHGNHRYNVTLILWQGNWYINSIQR